MKLLLILMHFLTYQRPPEKLQCCYYKLHNEQMRHWQCERMHIPYVEKNGVHYRPSDEENTAKGIITAIRYTKLESWKFYLKGDNHAS